ncbi:MAG: signal peptidase I [Planctomycetota bacterium]|jgi:signal peptidase I
MAVSKTGKSNSSKPPQKTRDRAAEIANTFEWLITAFILAFVFRAFIMEAFRIPTGSMADTLKGAHFRLRCRQCGYRYEYGFVPDKYGLPDDYVPPPGNLRSFPSRCPSCGYYQATGGVMPVANGDRILVLKCLYQFFEPKRWDVIVFKNPLDPRINYIKRLVGLPEEELEIIDGDIYINGKIARKPPKVQNELWMPVYDNDYQPVNPYTPAFNRHQWTQPFKAGSFSKWEIDEASPTLFRLDSSADQINSMVYSTLIGNDFRATYAYNEVGRYKSLPYCSDLMVLFYANPHESEGFIGIELSKYENHYKAWVDCRFRDTRSNMTMNIAKVSKGKETLLSSKSIGLWRAVKKPSLVKFANVDHRLIFQFGSEKLTCDLGLSPEAAGPRKTKIEPQVRIFGSGKLTLSHVSIFRDIHYTAPNGLGQGRAAEDNPFLLEKDEFFVLGDNSPNSQDSRWWHRPGKANNGLSYREGTVPRDYLVGKALFIYWPSGFKFPWPESFRTFLFRNSQHSRLCRVMYWIVSLNWIPNIEQSFIYGGSNKSE